MLKLILFVVLGHFVHDLALFFSNFGRHIDRIDIVFFITQVRWVLAIFDTLAGDRWISQSNDTSQLEGALLSLTDSTAYAGRFKEAEWPRDRLVLRASTVIDDAGVHGLRLLTSHSGIDEEARPIWLHKQGFRSTSVVHDHGVLELGVHWAVQFLDLLQLPHLSARLLSVLRVILLLRVLSLFIITGRLLCFLLEIVEKGGFCAKFIDVERCIVDCVTLSLLVRVFTRR